MRVKTILTAFKEVAQSIMVGMRRKHGILFNPDTVEAYAKRAEISPKPLYAAPPVSVTPDAG